MTPVERRCVGSHVALLANEWQLLTSAALRGTGAVGLVEGQDVVATVATKLNLQEEGLDAWAHILPR
jgi:hypothetical protein